MLTPVRNTYRWEASGSFQPSSTATGDPFVICKALSQTCDVPDKILSSDAIMQQPGCTRSDDLHAPALLLNLMAAQHHMAFNEACAVLVNSGRHRSNALSLTCHR